MFVLLKEVFAFTSLAAFSLTVIVWMDMAARLA